MKQSDVRDLFDYTDDEFFDGTYRFLGALVWRMDNRTAGARSLSRIKQFGIPLAGTWGERKGVPYCRVNVRGRLFYAHRLTWILHHGDIPYGFEVDHRDVNTLNGRIGNLRLAERVWNARNRKSVDNSESSFVGVSRARGGRWRARYMKDRVEHHIGHFSSEHEAASARDSAVKEAFGEFAHLNFRPGDDLA